jgi:hypothetical protein
MQVVTPGVRHWMLAGALACAACSDSSGPSVIPSPSPISQAPPSTTPPSTTPPSTTPPVTTPPASSVACALGKGTLDTYCTRKSATFLPRVDAAIDQLTRERPQLFNLSEVAGPEGYRVLDVPGFYAGLTRNLQGMGFCTEIADGLVQLKDSNALSEGYDVLLSSEHLRRGAGSYRATCTPAAFPLDPEDVIAQVRVGFYGIRCGEDQTAPRNGDGILPMGCTGFVTATPKTRDGRDVASGIHGATITWKLLVGEGERVVKVDDVPDQPFNKIVYPEGNGYFTLCATVRSMEGCVAATVVPYATVVQ